jgi:hypothetical protein
LKFLEKRLKIWRTGDSIGVAVVRVDVRPSPDGHDVDFFVPRMVRKKTKTLGAD